MLEVEERGYSLRADQSPCVALPSSSWALWLVLFSPGALANPNLPRLKSEMPQLNISDMRSGLELSSSKYCLIKRLAYHLQYGNLEWFLIL